MLKRRQVLKLCSNRGASALLGKVSAISLQCFSSFWDCYAVAKRSLLYFLYYGLNILEWLRKVKDEDLRALERIIFYRVLCWKSKSQRTGVMSLKSFMDSANWQPHWLPPFRWILPQNERAEPRGRFCSALCNMELFRPNSVLNYALLFHSNFLTFGRAVPSGSHCWHKLKFKKMFEKLQYWCMYGEEPWNAEFFCFMEMESSKHIAWHYQATVCQFHLASEQVPLLHEDMCGN